MRVLILLSFLLAHLSSYSQSITTSDIEGIFTGYLREGHSRHSKVVAIRFYSDGGLIATIIPSEVSNPAEFAQMFTRESSARFSQAKYMVVGSTVEFPLNLEGDRFYYKGTAQKTETGIKLSFNIKNMTTRGEYTMTCVKIWPTANNSQNNQNQQDQSQKVSSDKNNQNNNQTTEDKTKTTGQEQKDGASADKNVDDNEDSELLTPEEIENEFREIEDGGFSELSAEDTMAITNYLNDYNQLMKAEKIGPAVIALNSAGSIYFKAGQFENALGIFQQALQIKSLESDKKGMATLNNNIAAAYERLNQRNSAINYYKIAAGLYAESGLHKESARMLHNIAQTEKNFGNNKGERLALEKLIEREETLDDKQELSASYNNLAVNYYNAKQYEKALETLEKGIRIDETLEFFKGLAIAYNNRGNVYFELGKLDDALKNYKEALSLKQSLKNEASTAITLHNIGNVFAEQGNIDSARRYYEKSVELAEIGKDLQTMHANYKAISNLMAKKDGCGEPLEYYKLYTNLRFAVNENRELKQLNEVRQKYIDAGFQATQSLADDLARMEAAHEQDLLAINLLQEDIRSWRKTAMLEINSKQQEITLLAKDKELLQTEKAMVTADSERKTYLLAGAGLAVLLATGLFIVAYNSNRRNKKARKEIYEQKLIIEEKNNEFIESVTYARRLQDAILPPESLFQAAFAGNSFVLYMPKDIVAGDFYWLEQEGDYTFIAAADCTGHGVPGAMVSVVCANALDRAVKEFKLKETGEILDKVRELVIETFRKSEHEVKDGMDIALCRIDKKYLKVQYSGAHNPIWILKKRSGREEIKDKVTHDGTYYIAELKADKQPVGQFTAAKSFTFNEIQLDKGDTIYLFSDGYGDQFGGPKGKKMKVATLKSTIFANHKLNMPQQREKLLRQFNSWRGDYEQVDDVCVIGVRV